MNWVIASLVFLLSIADDLLVVFYMRRVAKGDRLAAALLSGVLTGLVGVEVVIYAPEAKYLIPNMLGSVIGTPLALWIEDRLPKVRSRDKAGKFKLTPAIAKEEAEWLRR